MPDFFNPPTIHAPASSYSHGATHALTGRRLVISGQIGVHPDAGILYVQRHMIIVRSERDRY